MPAGSDSPTNGEAPLRGLTVLVTRTREQSAALVAPLEALGAEVLAMPVIEVVDPEDWTPADEAIRALATYDWLVLTSTNGVDRFLARLDALGVDRSALDGLEVAVVGSATARRLVESGVVPDVIPSDFRAEGLVECLRIAGAGPETRVLIARALEAREVLPEQLREMGAVADVVPVYRVVPAAPDPAALEALSANRIAVATFASGGTARRFVDLLRAAGLDPDAVMSSLLAASVGPVTSAELRSMGYSVDIEARESTMESLVEAIADHYSCPKPRE